ncbi:uncharacterized protein Triagg1_3560 [Trichoderma aggressivum f. europaeum]|uniref:Uncharacterized protein n=1 Tax=Trichoderma aggressivum f. europaeum TaxID=173218 RepID=A0AAE1M269_9HYPO|nr:hypothetical protein Triagg1_3560 [Trichoderma aggressivum f. europaeum]
MLTQKTLDQQISFALAAARKSKTSLIHISDLPVPWRHNDHIFHGYRFTESCTYCIRSIFHLHNESFNIWSHLLGCLYFVKILVYDNPSVSYSNPNKIYTTKGLVGVYYVYLMAAIACTACSMSWHTMRCISSSGTLSCFSTMDLMGVTTLALASVLVTQFNAFVDSPYLQLTYMAMSVILGTAAVASCWLPIMRATGSSWLRIAVWIGLVAEGVAIPVVHLLWTRGLQATLEIYGPMMPPYGPIVVGALLYASQFPECVWPGRFDYFGGSHNILHVLSLWSIWLGIGTLRTSLEASIV